MQNQDLDPRIVTDLLNTGETLWQNARPLKPFAPKLPAPSVQWSIAVVYLMKAIFGFA
jgi:hypothetical protein